MGRYETNKQTKRKKIRLNGITVGLNIRRKKNKINGRWGPVVDDGENKRKPNILLQF